MMNKGLRGLRVKENEMGDPLTFVTFGLTDNVQDIVDRNNAQDIVDSQL